MAEDIDKDAALVGFAAFWPEALANAEKIGLKHSGLDIRHATELARQVYLCAFYDGARHGAERLKDAVLSAHKAGSGK